MTRAVILCLKKSNFHRPKMKMRQIGRSSQRHFLLQRLHLESWRARTCPSRFLARCECYYLIPSYILILFWYCFWCIYFNIHQVFVEEVIEHVCDLLRKQLESTLSSLDSSLEKIGWMTWFLVFSPPLICCPQSWKCLESDDPVVVGARRLLWFQRAWKKSCKKCAYSWNTFLYCSACRVSPTLSSSR